MNFSSDKKRGQVTIFIILAIMIVSVVLIFFLWVKPTYFNDESEGLGFEKCVENVVEDAIGELEKNAGFIKPEFSYSYNGEELTYLCYTNQYYQTCTMQVPFLKNSFDEQMETLIKKRVEGCYDASVDELKSEGYDVVPGKVEYDVFVEPGVVRVEIDAPTVVGSQGFVGFEAVVNAPVYEMVMMATSILQFESKYGDSDTSSMTMFYPDYLIHKIKRGDGTTVYIIENKITGNKFQFASRSLVFPAGHLL